MCVFSLSGCTDWLLDQTLPGVGAWNAILTSCQVLRRRQREKPSGFFSLDFFISSVSAALLQNGKLMQSNSSDPGSISRGGALFFSPGLMHPPLFRAKTSEGRATKARKRKGLWLFDATPPTLAVRFGVLLEAGRLPPTLPRRSGRAPSSSSPPANSRCRSSGCCPPPRSWRHPMDCSLRNGAITRCS